MNESEVNYYSDGEKKIDFDPHLISPNILRRHEILYDKVNIVDNFFYPNYGARIWRWELPLEKNDEFWTFQYGQNPGGDLEIADFCLRRAWTP